MQCLKNMDSFHAGGLYPERVIVSRISLERGVAKLAAKQK
jgi:hypothetical protein